MKDRLRADHKLPFTYLYTFLLNSYILSCNSIFMQISLSRPCVEDPTRYIAECNLGEKLIMERLCGILKESGLKGVKCSIKLGVARFEFEGRSVMLYQSGRVDIRRIQNIDEAERVLERIRSLVKDAFSGTSS